MANILFLAHRIPYPPNKGDKIRSWNFLKALAADHHIHLGFFIDNPEDEQYVPFLREQVASLSYEIATPLRQKFMSLRSLVKKQPLTIGAYPYGTLQKYADDLITAGEIDLIFLFSAATGPIVMNRMSVPVLTDLVDVDSEKWAAYAEQSFFPMSWIYRREARLLSAYERELCDKSNQTYLVSDQEAALFKKRHRKAASSVVGLKNGVDVDVFFPPDNAAPGKTVIFTGAMDYKPNVEAVSWFVSEIWGRIIAEEPAAELIIAGGPENPSVRKLETYNNVRVTGYVDSMPEMLRNADIAIAPLLTARGIQNKVLEAMACALPVVATSAANEGIEAAHKKAIYIADDVSDFSAYILDLLKKPDLRTNMGRRARQFVKESFSWQSAAQQLKADIAEVLGHAE